MDLIVPTNHGHEGFCSFQHFHGESTRNCSFFSPRRGANKVGIKLSSKKVYVRYKAPFLVQSADSFDCKKRKPQGFQKQTRVFAVSKNETLSSNAKLKNVQKSPHGHLVNGHISSSQENSSHNFEEFESNNHLRRMVRNGELEEGFKFLESMVYHGDIPDIIPCTSLIRGFCKVGKTRKATRVMEIIEDSGAVPDVITYNVLISGYCKSGEIDNAFRLLDRMSVAPDVVTYNTILRTLCIAYEGLAKEALELLNQLCSKGVVKKSSAEQVAVKM
ncbi:hypothetical protein Pint_08529 [Pistacia integerrima]|uniref:Uncharacterized protein n=1 Tax=Pistacia integerrima TaxID=434235 RepID=A0ACC0XUH3_9ROSI|nr:hypothetical protein Pint_08529 [Pistacia integerrima]